MPIRSTGPALQRLDENGANGDVEMKLIPDQPETALILCTCAPSGQSFCSTFHLPLRAGAWIQADDWDPAPKCGGGLHGLLWGEGDGSLLLWGSQAVWMVVEALVDDCVGFVGKVKFPRCIVRHVGDRQSATGYIQARRHGAAVVGGTVTVGDYGLATVGDYGEAIAGRNGTAIASHGGSAVVDDYGTAIVGSNGSAVAGIGGSAAAGDRGVAIAGRNGSATAGIGGSATAGRNGTIQIRWRDGRRFRISTGYIGEDGLQPDYDYRLDSNGRFVAVNRSNNECGQTSESDALLDEAVAVLDSICEPLPDDICNRISDLLSRRRVHAGQGRPTRSMETSADPDHRRICS